MWDNIKILQANLTIETQLRPKLRPWQSGQAKTQMELTETLQKEVVSGLEADHQVKARSRTRKRGKAQEEREPEKNLDSKYLLDSAANPSFIKIAPRQAGPKTDILPVDSGIAAHNPLRSIL